MARKDRLRQSLNQVILGFLLRSFYAGLQLHRLCSVKDVFLRKPLPGGKKAFFRAKKTKEFAARGVKREFDNFSET